MFLLIKREGRSNRIKFFILSYKRKKWLPRVPTKETSKRTIVPEIHTEYLHLIPEWNLINLTHSKDAIQDTSNNKLEQFPHTLHL